MKIVKILKIFGTILVAGTQISFAGTENASAGTENSREVLMLGIEKEKIAVAEWEAASDDDAEAKVNLAEYLARSSRAENKQRARELLEKFAARGNAHAMYILAKLRSAESNFRPQTELLRESAERGYVPAMLDYARALPRYSPEFGIWLEKAAAAGDFEATEFLAGLLEHGKELPQDLPRAFALYKKLAETNDGNALFNVARCLEKGIGVEKNLEESQKYLRRAVIQKSWLARQKYLASGTQNWAIPLEIFGLRLGEKIAPEKEKTAFSPVRLRLSGCGIFPFYSEIDWLGMRWKMRETYRLSRNLVSVTILHRSEPQDLARDNEIYEQILAILMNEYGEFLRLPQPGVCSLWREFEYKKTVFYDGRAGITLCLAKNGVSVSYWLSDDRMED